jgi:hypothetical protein
VVDPDPIATAALAGNADVDWEKFDAADYFEHNYLSLHWEDAQVIRLVADFFATAAPPRRVARAIDVGTGANLYPAMTMLPFASEIVLCERSHTSLRWLVEQLREPADSWPAFWAAISAGRPVYSAVDRALELLGRNARVTEGNLFELETDQYDLGTMFFVAESVTTRDDEFQRGIDGFVGALTSGAPFAAAFMRKSSGYFVGGQPFPACYVTEDDVARCLAEVADVAEVRVIGSHDLRDGYDGMIVACGHKK